MTTFRPQADGIPVINKAPGEVLDYVFDFDAAAPIGPWLQAGETITAASFTVPTGINKEAESFTLDKATVWISGGTVGTTYTVSVHVTTSSGRQGTRSFKLAIANR